MDTLLIVGGIVVVYGLAITVTVLFFMGKD